VIACPSWSVATTQEFPVHVLVTDLKLPDIDGLAVLERILQIDSKVIGIVMTGYDSIVCVVKAMKAGVFDFLTKPFENEVVVGSINKAVEAHRRRKNMQSSRKTVREQYRLEQFAGTSEPIRRVLEFVAKVADSEPIKRLAK
jgi:DNA-binding NtrC family response regulator